MMTREQREKANRLVETLLDVAPERRHATLESIVESLGDDAASIREEVERLLQEDEGMADRLSTMAPVIEAATRARTAGMTRLSANAVAGLRDRVPSIIGRYHLRGPLGNGGMGVVYLAEQRAPIARTVAIKLIRAGFDTHEVIARFEAERQALARMDHPGIARVLDAGATEAGRPYFVMEYVPGTAITEFADSERLSIRQRLELFAQVCDAISHAHVKGVIHRDLKPSNVLALKGSDGLPVVKVIDFGIAKALTPSDRLGRTTQYTSPDLVLGTYEYMSPEQAAGTGDIDTRSDVYSLGVLLYELLSGTRPFEREELSTHTDEELRRVIRDVEPPRPSSRLSALMRPATSLSKPKTSGGSASAEKKAFSPESNADARRSEPRSLVRTLQRELEWIPMMAMRKDRTRRYNGAAELAADVRNALAGAPLVAAPESRRYRARKALLAHRRAIAIGALTLLLLVAGVIGTSIGLIRESAARRLADANGILASRAAYRSAIAAADVALHAGDGVSLRWALDSAPTDLRGWEWNWLARSGSSSAVELHREPTDRFIGIVPLSDNRRAWCISRNTKIVVLWDIMTGETIRREAGTAVCVAPSGKRVAIARPDGAIEMVETDSGTVLWHLAPPSGSGRWQIDERSISLDGSTVVAWDGTNALTAIDAATGQQRRLPTGVKPEHVHGFVDYEDGISGLQTVVFSSEQSFKPLALNVQTGAVTTPTRFDFLIGSFPFSNNSPGQMRAITRGITFNVPQRQMNEGMAYLPKSNLMVGGQEPGNVTMYSAQPRTVPGELTSRVPPEPRRLIIGNSPIYSIASTPDEQRLIACTTDGSAYSCPVDEPGDASAPMGALRGSAMSPDGSKIVVGGWGQIQCYDVRTGMPVWGRNLGPYENRYVAWSPDGSTVVAAAGPIPLDADAPPGTWPLHDFFVVNGTTGEQIAAFSKGAVTLDAQHSAASPEWTRGMRGMTFSADSKQLIVSHSGAPPARIDVSTWLQVGGTTISNSPAAPRTYPRSPGVLVRSPAGGQYAEILGSADDQTESFDSGVFIRDRQTLAATTHLGISGASATAVAWSSDGRHIAAAFAQPAAAYVVLFDLKTGSERFRVSTPDGSPVTAIVCSTDGKRIFAFTRSRRLLVIDGQTGDELLASSTANVVLAAFMTPEGALITGDDAHAFVRFEAQDPERLMASVRSVWPSGLEKPETILDARSESWKANQLVHDAYAVGRNVLDPSVATSILADPIGRATLMEWARRCPPNINELNSAALSVMLLDHPTDADLERAADMLRLSSSLKPQSATLQSNLGSVLFRSNRYAEALEHLRSAIRIIAARGAKADAQLLIRCAIAAHRCGDPDAPDLHHQAMAAWKEESSGEDPETRGMVEMLKAEFGDPQP